MCLVLVNCLIIHIYIYLGEDSRGWMEARVRIRTRLDGMWLPFFFCCKMDGKRVFCIGWNKGGSFPTVGFQGKG